MNKAVFNMSLLTKLATVRDKIGFLILAMGPAMMLLAFGLNLPEGYQREMIAGYLFGAFSSSIFYMVVPFLIVSEAIISPHSIGNASPMSLVFSRPISRLNYVLTKWVAACAGSIVFYLLAAVGFQLACPWIGVNTSFLDVYSGPEIVLNCLSHSAMVVFLHSLPSISGGLVYLGLTSLVNIGQLISQFNDKDAAWYARALREVVLYFSYWFGDFANPKIDLYTLLTSVNFDWLPVVIYLSNILIFIIGAAWIMCKREFFYGAD